MARFLVVDLDGTLFDTNVRFELCLKEVGAKSLSELAGAKRRQFWQCYQSSKYMGYDRLNEKVADLVRRAKERGWTIIILTGRSEETQKQVTMQQLESNGIPYDQLIMRRPGDFRKDSDFKGEVIKELAARGEVIVIDDSEDVRKILSGRSYAPDNIPSNVF